MAKVIDAKGDTCQKLSSDMSKSTNLKTTTPKPKTHSAQHLISITKHDIINNKKSQWSHIHYQPLIIMIEKTKIIQPNKKIPKGYLRLYISRNVCSCF